MEYNAVNVSVFPGRMAGSVRAPDSKSHAHRLLICAALCEGETHMPLRAPSDDILATARCLRALGAGVDALNGETRVMGVFSRAGGRAVSAPSDARAEAVLDVGECGAAYRFLMPVVCALGMRARFTLGGRLPMRPIEPLARELIRHGARVEGMGTSEVRVRGALESGEYHLPRDISSQFVSALLFALPLLKGDSLICIAPRDAAFTDDRARESARSIYARADEYKELARTDARGRAESFAYIEMTLDTLRAFGVRADIDCARDGVRVFVPGGQTFVSPGYASPEGDWSGAACLLCGAAVSGGEARVSGLNAASRQGDRAIIDYLRRFGARVMIEGGDICVSAGALAGCEVDVSATPDLAPALAILGAAAAGETALISAGRLRLKESDRMASIPATLSRLGARAWADADAIRILGARRLNGGEVDSAGDHRIVMLASCLALMCASPVRVTRAQAVSKSYPGWFDALENMGINVIREGGE